MPPRGEEIRRVLDDIQDPCSVANGTPMGLDEMGIVKAVEVGGDGTVEVTFRLTSPFCEMVAFMRQETIAKVGRMPGVTRVEVAHDSGLDWDHDLIAPAAQARRQRRLDALARLPRSAEG
jgi:metal-sulfur cluster biosynthetic enzyme